MSRTVDEWVADHDDQAIPKRVKARIFERFQGRCAITGLKLRPGEFEFDHIVALANGGRHAEFNIQLVSKSAHRDKTNQDVDLKAKIQRQSLKDKGLWPKSRNPIRSRGFAPSRPQPEGQDNG